MKMKMRLDRKVCWSCNSAYTFYFATNSGTRKEKALDHDPGNDDFVSKENKGRINVIINPLYLVMTINI